MKAVLVIDMPTKCSDCGLVEEWFNEYGEKTYYCSLHRTSVPKNGDVCKRLRPLPEKKYLPQPSRDFWFIQVGRNQMIDEIFGETE